MRRQDSGLFTDCSLLRHCRDDLRRHSSPAPGDGHGGFPDGGTGALALLCSRLEGLGGSFEAMRKLMRDAGQPGAAVVKAAGIALAGELGTQLCRDAGEEAMAGRIALASRVAILSLCVPMLAELLELVAGVLS